MAGSDMARLLLQNLLEFERYTAALALANRTLAADPMNEDAADVLVHAQDQLDARRTADMMQRGSAARRMLRRMLAPASTGPRKP